ncbi:hypothetical protein [Chitinibacter tainanensis]|uniref:hypothetical protein n=1 Tax=Chitinibacter tainanensis TaxID=230667 RepID=UPI000400F61C|nr:hypothetical protein [Chitinibacter tainanensis]
MHFRKRITLAAMLLLVGVTILLMGYFIMPTMAYSHIGSSTSPNGKFTAHLFRSNQDGFGHAPYGQVLALSEHAQLRSPDDGYVIFAGYCKNALSFEWEHNETIKVRCINPNIRTLATIAYGLNVVHRWE